MGSLQCEKKLRALDGYRDQVHAATKTLSDANTALLSVTQKAKDKKGFDDVTTKAFTSARDNLQRAIDDLEKKLDTWESEHRKLIKDVLDTALDKAKREKDKELDKSCAPIKDYLGAAEAEIKSTRSLIESAKMFLEKNRRAFAAYVFQTSK
jgi:chromosome segregation ATPase